MPINRLTCGCVPHFVIHLIRPCRSVPYHGERVLLFGFIPMTGAKALRIRREQCSLQLRGHAKPQDKFATS
jgi:hypothetical protein